MLVHYVSGSRADFGLMERCLVRLNETAGHEVRVAVTGQHTVPGYGDTETEICESGLHVACRVPVELSGSGGGQMALAMSAQIAGFTRFWSSTRPDLVLLLGDRGEMLAAACAAVHLGIHTAHIHGGERSGTLDESFRHAISKLAHIHFPATEDAAKRLISMGEEPSRITVTGAPGLVGIKDGVTKDTAALKTMYGLPDDRPVALVVFHPVVQEAASAAGQTEQLLDGVLAAGVSALVLRPNSDAGGAQIDQVLDRYQSTESIHVAIHLDRMQYLAAMASCDIMIGNSSSGIIESSSFGIPCVNIGTRQSDRLRNLNTLDCPDCSAGQVRDSILSCIGQRFPAENVYGNGDTDEKLLAALNRLDLSPDLLVKRNTY